MWDCNILVLTLFKDNIQIFLITTTIIELSIKHLCNFYPFFVLIYLPSIVCGFKQ